MQSLRCRPTTKNKHSEAKKQFAEEKKKPENGKAFGQPVNAKMVDILKKNGMWVYPLLANDGYG
jgi:gamma-glutamyltranspeptidase